MGKKNCIVAQSGGPTVAINASLAGVVKGVKDSQVFDTIYGSVNGILGILNNNVINLSEIVANEETLNRLKHTPSMYLGSCRYKLPTVEESPETYAQIFEMFESLNIGAFFYIGGNDSMDTALKLSQYAASIGSDVRVIGVPKTIDNDLCLTDHTPGFGSAAKYIASTILEIAHDTFSYPVPSVTIVEIMGRDAGWLTSASALARNEYNTAPHSDLSAGSSVRYCSVLSRCKRAFEKTEHGYHCRIRGYPRQKWKLYQCCLPDHRWFWSQPLKRRRQSLREFCNIQH